MAGREDWYRNTFWNPEIEAAFFEKLRRARDKSQYLRIQACILAESRPDVALRLLDQYFGCERQWEAAQAHNDRATAYLAQGELENALLSLESALSVERARPNSLTQAYLDFSCLVAVRRLVGRYDRAMQVLDDARDRPAFPVERYRWNGARALILHEQGDRSEA